MTDDQRMYVYSKLWEWACGFAFRDRGFGAIKSINDWLSTFDRR